MEKIVNSWCSRYALIGCHLSIILLQLSTANCRRYNGPGSEVLIDSLIVPSPVRVGATVQLECNWRVGTRGFNALRWFKGIQEIYLYNQGERRGVDHNVPGINILLDKSDQNVLTLSNVTPEAQGNYTCEIMSEGPPFGLAKTGKVLSVVELPETPQLIGLRSRYQVGDTLNVTCQASNGLPAPRLTLKLNGEPIVSGRLRKLAAIPGTQPGYFTSRTQLVLTLSQSLAPTFTLGCYAQTHGLQVENEVHIQVHEPVLPFLTFFGSSANHVAAGNDFPLLILVGLLAIC